MTTVYKIVGCDHRYREVEFCLTRAEAGRRATEMNQQTADGLGLSYRAYHRRSAWGEGWHVAGRPGRHMERVFS